MKKFPGFRIFLSILLALQLVCVPVSATNTENATADPSESEAATQPAASPAGDASVHFGCNSINAGEALMNTAEVDVDLSAALVYEMNSDTLLYSYNVDTQVYPASVTKVMTCLLALELGDMDEMVTVSQSVVDNRDPDGSSCDLQAGEEISMKDLVFCLMVASANDAGSAISEHIAGSEDAFVELMNQKAEELGCTNTNFSNPHGLHDENHYTSARDMAKIMIAAMEYDLFLEAYSAKSYEVPATNKSEARTLRTTNYMIDKYFIDNYYDSRVIGGKTGFTTPAGRCLASVSESGSMKLLTVVMGGKTELSDSGYTVYGSFQETGELISYAYSNYTAGQILSPDAVLAAFPVSGGENNTQAYVKNAVSTVVPMNLSRSQLRYEYLLDDGTLTAPITADESLGIVRVWYQSKCIAQQEIFATVASQIKQDNPVQDLAMENPQSQDNGNAWHVILVIILVLLAVIVVMLVISAIRNSVIRARRARRRRSRRRSQ